MARTSVPTAPSKSALYARVAPALAQPAFRERQIEADKRLLDMEARPPRHIETRGVGFFKLFLPYPIVYKRRGVESINR